ncbi:unnamed protein product [Brugia pahangi]|uniref:G_PROTEIN_RECEP_F2_4 domain-containing protein n=1 Tax=Brugia pahangi TaxID=6280 RepID=A0A0N4SYU1_BRUPA|nr:unnamed protein product [Brugia pahangi]
MNDDEIINFIGNLLLKNLPKSSNDTFNYVPGESLPYCLLEDGALAKSLADVVSMNFTEICPKSECIYYLSPLEFFVYCCCNTNYELCAYTSDEQLLSYASKNALTWATNPLIRSFREVLIYDIKTDIFTEVSGRPWTYRKYVYSKPTVDKRTGNVTSSADNIPLHLCAFGTFNLTIGNWKNEDFTMKIGKRKMLAEPQKFCYYMPSLQFTKTDRKPPTSLEVRYGSDTEELCKREGCNIKAPTCLQDLISIDHVIATFRCCCNAGDLCNHLGNKYFQETKQLISATQNYDKTIQHGCIRKIFLPFHDPFCELHIPVLTNLIQCSCFQSPILKQPCDAEFGTKVRNEGPKIAVPMCLKTFGNLNELLDNTYDFGIIGPAKYEKTRTKNYPLCYDMIAIDSYKHGIEHRSGPFDEIISYLYNVSKSVNIMRRIMTFTVLVPGTNYTTTRYLYTCYQRENYYPCNGPITIRKQLLPEIIWEESTKYSSKERSLCQVDGYSNRIRCKSRKGCFDFHTVHGFRMRGCIDKIPKIVSMMPKFRLLYTCYGHVWITGNENTRCIAVSENDFNSTIPLTDGILCCCRSTCRMSDSNSYMEMQHGYYPFQM